MRYDELTMHQQFLLRLVATNSDYKASGLQIRDCNYLASQKILSHAGNLRYEVTEEGKLLLQSDPIYSNPVLETIE